MTNESTEAVLELCLKTQHENTKRAILKYIAQEYPISVEYGEWQFSEAEDIAKFISELKLEDAK